MLAGQEKEWSIFLDWDSPCSAASGVCIYMRSDLRGWVWLRMVQLERRRWSNFMDDRQTEYSPHRKGLSLGRWRLYLPVLLAEEFFDIFVTTRKCVFRSPWYPSTMRFICLPYQVVRRYAIGCVLELNRRAASSEMRWNSWTYLDDWIIQNLAAQYRTYAGSICHYN